MHVKEQVKDFVHDVKRRFSQKYKRDTCSSFDSYDHSNEDTLSHLDDSSSCSSASSILGTPERSRLLRFIRPRTSSTTSKNHHSITPQKIKRSDSKRYRLFSSHSAPSERSVEPNRKQTASLRGPSGLSRDIAGERATTFGTDYSDVIDIRARQTGSATTQSIQTTSSTQSSRRADCDSLSQSQPLFDTESRSDTSGTLVTASSGADREKSASESDSRFDSLDFRSDVHDSSLLYPMTDPSPPEEEIVLAPPLPAAPPPPPPAQPVRSTPASPAPVYIPRLTAPSMFLPIPNTDPLSALLTKYVPAEQRPRRDVVGEYAGRDVHEMVMSNSWRALAKMARDRIVASDPEDLGRILDLWSLRLSSLARLRLTNQASAECSNLFAVLNAVPATSVPGTFPGSGSLPPSTPLPSSPSPAAPSPLSPSGLSGLAQLPGTPSQKQSTLSPSFATPATAPRQGTHELLHPFELTVFHARVHYWSGDSLGYVDALSRILGKCKERAREEGRIVAQRRELGKAAKARGGGDTEGTSQSEQANEDEDEDQGKGDAEESTENEEDQYEVEDENKDVEGSTENGEVQDKAENENENEDKVEDRKDAAESTENDKVRDEEQDDVLVTAEANLSMWLERIARICLILASQMIEMNGYQAAINLLAPLCTHRTAHTFQPTTSPALHSSLARVYLLSGNLHKAQEHFSVAASAAVNSTNGADMAIMNTALFAAASGDWPSAEEALSGMVAKDPGNFTAINNLAVTLLSQGRIKEGIDLLEAALKTSPSSVVVAEPFLFNLSTLYELRSTAAIDKKRGLLIEVSKWSGDGLRTSCLKMPSS